MKKYKQREVIGQGHTVTKEQSWDLNPGVLTLEATVTITLLYCLRREKKRSQLNEWHFRT